MEFTGTVVDAKEETVNIRLKMDEPYGGAEHEWNCKFCQYKNVFGYDKA